VPLRWQHLRSIVQAIVGMPVSAWLLTLLKRVASPETPPSTRRSRRVAAVFAQLAVFRKVAECGEYAMRLFHDLYRLSQPQGFNHAVWLPYFLKSSGIQGEWAISPLFPNPQTACAGPHAAWFDSPARIP
jgi:hypothetical protein